MTRKPILLAAAGAVIVAALIVAVWLMWQPAIAPVSPPPASSFDSQTKLAGARVVALGDCIVCHTAKGGKPFATYILSIQKPQPAVANASAAAAGAAQCGYCIAGMIMRAQALLDRNPRPTESELREHMEPNLCRCGTHMRILAAIREVAHLPAGNGAPATAQQSAASNGGTQ